eukprot:12895203-Prorocentrum_lima.AAC.1
MRTAGRQAHNTHNPQSEQSKLSEQSVPWKGRHASDERNTSPSPQQVAGVTTSADIHGVASRTTTSCSMP